MGTTPAVNPHELKAKTEDYLDYLCNLQSGRRVGTDGNRAATDYVTEKFKDFGYLVKCPEFSCLDWAQEGAWLTARNRSFPVYPSPYTIGCEVTAPLKVVSTLAALETGSATGSILLLQDELAKEQLMPKNFTFYNPEHHRQIIGLLERRNPRAVVAATTRDPGMAGGVSPFPLIEDGDFDIPSVYMTAEEGKKLADSEEELVSLRILARRTPSTACNVVARKGDFSKGRVVIFAHIDCKDGTSGAIDNASGVVILLLLGDLLRDYSGPPGVELVALNGEDYYAASGEVQYLKDNEGTFDEIRLGINLDGVGYIHGNTAISLYDCPPEVVRRTRELIAESSELIEGPPWYQSDHSLFLMNQRPALAFTTAEMETVWTEIAHTPRDTPEIVDSEKLVEAAIAVRSLLAAVP